MKPATPEAYRLLHEGSIALARVERNGIRIDTAYLDRTIKEATQKVADMEADLRKDTVYKKWQQRYGSKQNFDARDQLATILFEELGYTSHKRTATRQWSADEENLERLELPFCTTYIECQKIKNVVARMVGLLREVEGEYLHPFFHLHKVETYRSSSSDPNFQNIPIRLDEQAKLIRPAFIPRPGRVLLEIDFKGAEVRVAACYHKDPTMLRYIADGYDMHRDMAAECYMLPKDAVPKDVRQDAKGLFTFAEFYGSHYLSVAESLWDTIRRHKLKTKAGVGLYDHLSTRGITGPGDWDALNANKRLEPPPGTYAHHIKKVDRDFWEKRFPVYDRWRRDIWEEYKRDGYIRTHTGFVIHGVFPRNFIINVGTQGSAFHCLLWCLIKAIQAMTRQGMETLVVGQIHDSMLLDVPEGELADVVALCGDIITNQLTENWRWLIVPIEVEAAACQPGGNWYEKEELKLAA